MKPRDIPHAIAYATAERAVNELETYNDVITVHIAGSLRRGEPFVSDIDLVIVAKTLDVKHEFAASPIQDPNPRTPYQIDGIQIDLCVVPPGYEGSALLHFTGPVRSNIRMRVQAKRRGLSLSQWGLVNPDHEDGAVSGTEADIFEALGLPFVAPEDRR